MEANVLLSTLNLSHEDWLDARTKGIGGSDAAAIAGLNPWKSKVGVFLDKTGRSEPIPDNERMRIGRDLEDYVAKRFEEATGMKTRRKNAILSHSEHDFILANVDRLIVGEREGLECKTTNSYAVQDWKDDKIPVHYELQCHHYMAVTGYKAWWIACLIGNESFVYKKIERDEEIINHLVDIEKNFWENYVLKNEMPAPDGSEDSGDMLKMMYPEAETDTVVELNQFAEQVARRDEINMLVKKLEIEKDQIDQSIQAEMKENEIAVIGDRKATWKNVSTNRLDSKKLKEEQEAIYNEYVKTTNSRRFLIK